MSRPNDYIIYKTSFSSESIVENMATTTRSSRNSRKKPVPMLLPDLWVTLDETSRISRPTVKPYYFNLRTRQTFYSKAALHRHFRSMEAQLSNESKRERAEEEKDHMCSRCKESGHECITCPYPIIHKINPFAGRRIRRCSRCHWLGHNVRTCPQAV